MKTREFLTIILLPYLFALSQILLGLMIFTSTELQAVYVIPTGPIGTFYDFLFLFKPFFKLLAGLVLISGTLGVLLATVICRKYFSSPQPHQGVKVTNFSNPATADWQRSQPEPFIVDQKRTE